MPFGMGPAGWWYLHHPYFRMPFIPPWPPYPYLRQEDELAFLEEEARILEKELQSIHKRIAELKNKTKQAEKNEF